jgi:hypothetical protein
MTFTSSTRILPDAQRYLQVKWGFAFANHAVIHFKDEHMLIFVVWYRTSAACIVGEYIFAEIRLLASAIEFEMISRDIGESQKLGQKGPKGTERIYMNVGHS